MKISKRCYYCRFPKELPSKITLCDAWPCLRCKDKIRSPFSRDRLAGAAHTPLLQPTRFADVIPARKKSKIEQAPPEPVAPVAVAEEPLLEEPVPEIGDLPVPYEGSEWEDFIL